jgi:hypothetical protein
MKKIWAACILAFMILSSSHLSTGALESNPLVQAAMRGDKAAVGALLRQGADIEGMDPSGYTALSGAAANDQIEMVKRVAQS